MTTFSNLRGTTESAFRIALRGATIYQGTADPTITPPTPIDILRAGDVYLRQGAVGTPFVYNGTSWVSLLTNTGVINATDVTTNNLTVNTLATFANGSAAAPSITFITDPNTGIYRAAADILGFTTGGVSALTIDATQNAVFAAGVTVQGDFVVNGTTTTVNSANLAITDNIITINNGEVGAGVTLGSAGIAVDRGLSTDAGVIWNETLDRWEVGLIGSTFQVWHQGNDGTGSGLDADLLDSLNSSAFLQVTNNLSELTATSTTAVANLGLNAGGTNDIWVNLSGDTMTGNLVMGGTARIQVVDGSTASPGLQFASDTDTGIRLVGAGVIGLVSNGADSMLVRPSGSGGASIVMNGTDAVQIPLGTTANRPASPTDGMIRFNSTLNGFEGYSSATWSSLGTIYTGGAGITVTGPAIALSNNALVDTAVATADTVPFFDASNANAPAIRSWASIITDLSIITTGNLASVVTSGRGINVTGSTIAFNNNLMVGTNAVVGADTVPFFDASNANQAEFRSWTNILTDLNIVSATADGILVRTAVNTYASRTITASVAAGQQGISVVNGNGVAGNPTVGLDINGLVTDGVLAGTDTFPYFNGTNNVKIDAATLATQLGISSTGVVVIEGAFALVNNTVVGSLPTNGRIMRVRVVIDTVYDNAANVEVNLVSGGDIMTSVDINAQILGTYERTIDYRNTGAPENVRIQITGGVPTVGAGRVFVEYYGGSAI
jgi:hypothetical protein